jgi:hypothetical protein
MRLNEPQILGHLVALYEAGWRWIPGNTSANYLKISFPIWHGELLDRQDATEVVANVVSERQLDWILPGDEYWTIDLSRVRKIVPLNPIPEWLNGSGFVEPRFERKLRPSARGGRELDARLSFYLSDECRLSRPRPWTYWRTLYGAGVFHLEITRDHDVRGGTAFLCGHRRIATCAHNLGGDIRICNLDGKPRASEQSRHETADVACLQVDQSVVLPDSVLPVRDDNPSPGEEVAAFGFASVPLRQPLLGIYVGTVEALPTDYSGMQQFIQVSINTAGGMSGGPVIDNRGRVLGIISERTFEAVDDGVPARAFAQVIPISYLQNTGV